MISSPFPLSLCVCVSLSLSVRRRENYGVFNLADHRAKLIHIRCGDASEPVIIRPFCALPQSRGGEGEGGEAKRRKKRQRGRRGMRTRKREQRALLEFYDDDCTASNEIPFGRSFVCRERERERERISLSLFLSLSLACAFYGCDTMRAPLGETRRIT